MCCTHAEDIRPFSPVILATIVDSLTMWLCTTGPRFESIRRVVYGDRDTIELLHEVIRQALRLPTSSYGTLRACLQVYRTWISTRLSPILFCPPGQVYDMEPMQDMFQRIIFNSVVVFSALSAERVGERPRLLAVEAVTVLQLMATENDNRLLSQDTWTLLMSHAVALVNTMILGSNVLRDVNSLGPSLLALLLEVRSD
jgi:hypothetical protein